MEKNKLVRRNVAQLFLFILGSVFMIVLGGLQAYYLPTLPKPYTPTSEIIPIIVPAIQFVFCLSFVVLGFLLYKEIGWDNYKQQGADPQVRSKLISFNLRLEKDKINLTRLFTLLRNFHGYDKDGLSRFHIVHCLYS
jgi:hypothetical protein